MKEGTPLYRIERGCSRPTVEQAQGALERSKAAHTLAVGAVAAGRGIAGQERRLGGGARPGLAQEQQTNGATSTDEANLQTAKINLGYTDIVAPISGRIGRTKVTKGNVVGPDSGVLTRHRQPGPDVCDVSGQPARVPAPRERGSRRLRNSRSGSGSPTGPPTPRPARSISST